MTTGVWLFSESDFKDWSKFLINIKRQAYSEQKNPGKLVWNQLTAVTQKHINDWKEDKEPDSHIKSEIIDELNDILDNKKFYYSDYFKDVEWPDEIRRLALKSVGNSDDNIIYRNRRLIEESFSETIRKSEEYYEKLIDQRCIQILERSYYSDIIQIGNKKTDGKPLFTNIIFHKSNLIKKIESSEKYSISESKYTEMCDVICEKATALLKFKMKYNTRNEVILSPYIPFDSLAILGNSNAHKRIVETIIKGNNINHIRSKDSTYINMQDIAFIFALNFRPKLQETCERMNNNLVGIILVLGLARSIKEKIDIPLNKIHEIFSLDEISNDINLRKKLIARRKNLYE